MKINHNGIQISIDSDGMHDGEKYQAEQAIRLCIDLYKEGRLKYMDLDVKNTAEDLMSGIEKGLNDVGLVKAERKDKTQDPILEYKQGLTDISVPEGMEYRVTAEGSIVIDYIGKDTFVNSLGSFVSHEEIK